MKRIHFKVYNELAEQINESIKRWGFHIQAEFFRYLAMEFIRNEKKLLTADDTLKEHAKAIRMIKSGQKQGFMDPAN